MNARQSTWLRQTKRLFPHPIFAGCISLSCLLVTLVFAAIAVGASAWPMGIASLVFLTATGMTCAATFSLIRDRKSGVAKLKEPPAPAKPTFAVLVLLIGVYSWLLTIAMHIFDAFFKNGPGSTKYYVTVGIAIASSVFMQAYGKRVIRKHFGAQGGRNLTLTSRQVGYVALLVFFFSGYFVWVAS